MNLKFLETFIWVAKLRSFSLAADKLHSTQAAISSRISSLEDDLGSKLFVRDPKGVSLTREGERVLEHAEEVCESVERLRASLADGSLAAGAIRIGAMDSVIHSWFIDFVKDVAQHYPNLDIEVTSDTALNLIDQLRRGALDIVFQTDMLRDETIRSAELLRLPIAWVATREFAQLDPDGGGTPEQALRTLSRTRRIITFSRHSRPHQDLLLLLRAYGINDARVSCVNSVAAMLQLTQAGFGVAAMPRALALDRIERGELAVIEGPVSPPPMPFVAAWRDGIEWAQRLLEIASVTTRRAAERLGEGAV